MIKINENASYISADQILTDLPSRLDTDPSLMELIKNDFIEEPDPRSPSKEKAIEWAKIHGNMVKTELGRWIRNSYGLWDDNNPHTMQRIRNLSGEEQAVSEFHPDNFSSKIIDRLVELYKGKANVLS